MTDVPAWNVIPHGQFFILRDDMLAGGTKRRALDLMLRDIPETDVSYVGTIFGHGALALALACEDHGKRAHLFLSSNDNNHPLLHLLRKTNAVLHAARPEPVAMLMDHAAHWSHNHDAYLFLWDSTHRDFTSR